MKLRTTLVALAFVGGLFSAVLAQDAATQPPHPGSLPVQHTAATDLRELVQRIGGKIREGARTAEALASEIAEFDALLAKYPAKDDASAEIAVMRAMLYLQVLSDEAKGLALLTAIKDDFPGTKAADAVEKILGQIAAAAQAKERASALAGQPAPELNFTWSSLPGLTKLSDLKGKVVVLDFWATWCGPCIRSFPQIREHVAHFAGAPVVFLGVTSLQGRVHGLEAKPIDVKGDPDREYALMPQFMEKFEMSWPVAFSAENVFNPDYGIEGIPFVAIIAPDGTVRHTGLHPGDPEGDITGKIEALLKEFHLTGPKS